MSAQMRVYFMALVGASAGLLSWAAVTLALLALPDLFADTGTLDVLNMTLLGGAICGMAVGFSDYWAEGRVTPLWVVTGVAIGLVFGLSGALLGAAVQKLLKLQAPLLARVLPWALLGELVGFGAGVRWASLNRHTPLLSATGGMIGAAVGGLGFSLSGAILPEFSDFIQATAFVSTGLGITAGATLAPQLLSEGVLRFVSSADPRAYKTARGAEWLIHDGDKLMIGSLSSHFTSTIYQKEVELFLNDEQVAARHAYVLAQHGRFYIENHPENVGPQGDPVKPLKLRDRAVVGIQELRDGDLLTVGSTQLRFESKRRHAS